jgi:uncharacterized protein YoxC
MTDLTLEAFNAALEPIRAKIDSLPDTQFLMRQQERLLNEFNILRDDLRVLSAIVMRLDTSMNGLTEQLRGMYTQISHFNERILKLEGAH